MKKLIPKISANMLSSIGLKFSSISQAVTVISIDERWIKLLQFSGKPLKRVTAVSAYPLTGKSDEEILGWLKGVCETLGISPGSVLISNPSHLTTTRFFTLPSVDPKEIRDIVELQAEKHTPYSKEEVISDFRILEKDKAGYSRVMLAISHQEVVYRALRIVESMGWSLERVGFELEGLVNWCHSLPAEARHAVSMVVEIDSDSTTVAILHGDRPYFHRSLAIGHIQLSKEHEETMSRFLHELHRSIEAFEAEGLSLHVSYVFLTGLASQILGLKEKVQQRLNLNTDVLLPFAGYELEKDILSKDEFASGVSFAGLLGLGSGHSQVDLTPKTLKIQKVFEVRNRLLMGIGYQLIAAVLLISLLVVGNAYKRERYHGQLLSKHNEILGQTEDLSVLLERVGLVKGWLSKRSELLDAVMELNDKTPPSIQWDSIAFIRQGSITVKGVSEEMPKVFDFAAALRQSGTFSNVEARRVNKRKVNDEVVTEFEIVCSFASEDAQDAQSEENTGG